MRYQMRRLVYARLQCLLKCTGALLCFALPRIERCSETHTRARTNVESSALLPSVHPACALRANAGPLTHHRCCSTRERERVVSSPPPPNEQQHLLLSLYHAHSRTRCAGSLRVLHAKNKLSLSGTGNSNPRHACQNAATLAMTAPAPNTHAPNQTKPVRAIEPSALAARLCKRGRKKIPARL